MATALEAHGDSGKAGAELDEERDGLTHDLGSPPNPGAALPRPAIRTTRPGTSTRSIAATTSPATT